jgi:hypothetical protein
MGWRSGGDRRGAWLVAVAALGALLFAPPLITLFDHGGQFLGAPIIWVYVFAVWAVLIGLVAALARKSG